MNPKWALELPKLLKGNHSPRSWSAVSFQGVMMSCLWSTLNPHRRKATHKLKTFFSRYVRHSYHSSACRNNLSLLQSRLYKVTTQRDRRSSMALLDYWGLWIVSPSFPLSRSLYSNLSALSFPLPLSFCIFCLFVSSFAYLQALTKGNKEQKYKENQAIVYPPDRHPLKGDCSRIHQKNLMEYLPIILFDITQTCILTITSALRVYILLTQIAKEHVLIAKKYSDDVRTIWLKEWKVLEGREKPWKRNVTQACLELMIQLLIPKGWHYKGEPPHLGSLYDLAK